MYSPSNTLIATHVLRTGKGAVVIDKEHYRGYRSGSDRTSLAVTAETLRARFQHREHIERFIDAVITMGWQRFWAYSQTPQFCKN